MPDLTIIYDSRGNELRPGDLARLQSGGKVFRVEELAADGGEDTYCGWVLLATTAEDEPEGHEALNLYRSGIGPYCPDLVGLEAS